MVEYTYDAWGKLLSTTGSMAAMLGLHNPLRYRAYVYDPETGLYYVSSRYYDPEIGRFINADVLVSTGQGLLGNNMFAYCVNNPVNMADPTGHCSCFLFFKKDCFSATCPNSQCYNPDAPNVVVIYDGRFSGYFGRFHDNGFEQQGSELCRRLNATSAVTSHSYTTVDEFIDLWNGLDGNYDTIYIVGHSIAGELRFKGNLSIAAQGGTYSFSDLNSISVDSIYLYTCNGATIDGKKGSVAMHLAGITGANIHAIKDGKLNLTWYGCFPIPKKGGYWVTVS